MTQPPAPPIIYLRAAGCASHERAAVEHAMWARGWRTTVDRTAAWHLARGGMTVILCDFSAAFDGLAQDTVHLGRVRARYADDGTTELVPTAGELARPTRPERFDPTRPNKGGGMGAHALDPTALADLVAEHIPSPEGKS